MKPIIQSFHNKIQLGKRMPFLAKSFSIILLLASFSTLLLSQEEAVESNKDLRPVKNTFESIWLIDNQTAVVPIKGTFEFDMQHRFGVVKNGYDDFYGLYAPSNIRLGFDYVPIKNLQVGFGFSKERLLWDFNAKYALFKQARKGGFPFSVTYFVNAAIDTRDKANFHNTTTDRFSFFNQLMVARKVNRHFSIQVAGSVSHFNAVDAFINADRQIEGKMNNDHVAVSVLGRYKFTNVMGFIVNYTQPVTDHQTNNPNPNFSFGLEMTSSSHAFQVFVTNFKSLVPQYSNVFNGNDPGNGDFLIGFNITKMWNW